MKKDNLVNKILQAPTRLAALAGAVENKELDELQILLQLAVASTGAGNRELFAQCKDAFDCEFIKAAWRAVASKDVGRLQRLIDFIRDGSAFSDGPAADPLRAELLMNYRSYQANPRTRREMARELGVAYDEPSAKEHFRRLVKELGIPYIPGKGGRPRKPPLV